MLMALPFILFGLMVITFGPFYFFFGQLNGCLKLIFLTNDNCEVSVLLTWNPPQFASLKLRNNDKNRLLSYIRLRL